MNNYSILLLYFVALAPFLIQEGESVIWVVGASTTVSLGGLILGGLLLKAGAAGIIGLASVGQKIFQFSSQLFKFLTFSNT